MDRLSSLTEGETIGVGSFHSGDPVVIMACLTYSTLSVWLQLINDAFGQTLLHDATADDDTPLFPKCNTKEVSDGAI
jgi:hypothetical protein